MTSLIFLRLVTDIDLAEDMVNSEGRVVYCRLVSRVDNSVFWGPGLQIEHFQLGHQIEGDAHTSFPESLAVGAFLKIAGTIISLWWLLGIAGPGAPCSIERLNKYTWSFINALHSLLLLRTRSRKLIICSAGQPALRVDRRRR